MFIHAHHFITAVLHVRAYALGFAYASLRVHVGACMAAMDLRIVSILETVRRELDKPQSAKHYAAQLRLSLSRFEHLFKRETGLGFRALVRAARMAKAASILQDPTARVKEVAAAVGYSDASNFAHDFRKQYGRSPSQSRRRAPEVLSLPPALRRGPGGDGSHSSFHQQIAASTNK